MLISGLRGSNWGGGAGGEGGYRKEKMLIVLYRTLEYFVRNINTAGVADGPITITPAYDCSFDLLFVDEHFS